MNTMILNRLDHLPSGLLNLTAPALCVRLGGITVLDLPGNQGKPLFIAVLLHGNEESGWEAVRVLQRRYADGLPRPLVILLGDLRAAAAGVRRLPGEQDLNRIWSADEPSEQGRALWRLREELAARGLHAAVDIHNTNGRNPPHALHVGEASPSQELAAAYTGITLRLDHGMGTCMEAFADLCPSVTLECGRNGDQAGLDRAVEYLDDLLCGGTPDTNAKRQHFRIGARVKPVAGVRLSFGDGPADLCVPGDVERLNFTKVPAGTVLGRVANDKQWPLEALDGRGQDVVRDYLRVAGDRLETIRDVWPAMLVADRDLVRLDCLCYFLDPEAASSFRATPARTW